MRADTMDYINAKIHAADCVEHCIVAYWDSSATNGNRAYHHSAAVGSLKKAADALGFDLVERAPAPSPAPVLSQAAE